MVVGRYYLADAGYAADDGYMTPFSGSRYHLNHFEGVDVSSLRMEEKFNYTYAKLRNIIERRFGVLKER